MNSAIKWTIWAICTVAIVVGVSLTLTGCAADVGEPGKEGPSCVTTITNKLGCEAICDTDYVNVCKQYDAGSGSTGLDCILHQGTCADVVSAL